MSQLDQEECAAPERQTLGHLTIYEMSQLVFFAIK
jgi:hypothetical protein